MWTRFSNLNSNLVQIRSLFRSWRSVKIRGWIWTFLSRPRVFIWIPVRVTVTALRYTYSSNWFNLSTFFYWKSIFSIEAADTETKPGRWRSRPGGPGDHRGQGGPGWPEDQWTRGGPGDQGGRVAVPGSYSPDPKLGEIPDLKSKSKKKKQIRIRLSRKIGSDSTVLWFREKLDLDPKF